MKRDNKISGFRLPIILLSRNYDLLIPIVNNNVSRIDIEYQRKLDVFLKGDMKKAEPAFRQSLKINPYEPMAHNNLGLIAARRGKLDEAMVEYKMEIANNPDYDNVYYNMGLLFYVRGQREDARKAWIKTIELNGFYVDAYKRLIAAYLEIKDFERADYYARELRKKGFAF